MLRRAQCAVASIRTGGGVMVGGANKEIHAAMSSVVHIRLLEARAEVITCLSL